MQKKRVSGKRKPKSEKKIEVVRAARLARYRWLAHGFSTRHPNHANLSFSSGPAARVERSRRGLLSALDAPGPRRRWQLVTLRQRHTDLIQVLCRDSRAGRRVSRTPDGALRLMGDAAITDQPGHLLAVQVADCLPILLVDPRQRVVAAVHAGWRGTLKRIAEKTIGRMQGEFGSQPRDLLAAVGPGIHACCYQVGQEVMEEFASQFADWKKFLRPQIPSPPQAHWQQPLFAASPPEPGDRRPRPALTSPAPDRFFLDLVEANCRQLRASGLKQKNIWVSPYCTACRTDLFFSYRAERKSAGRMMGVVGIRY